MNGMATKAAVTAQDNTRTIMHAGELPTEYIVSRWYAAHTNSNHEKRVAEQLSVRDVEYFLPLYESVRRWKDRKVKLQMPLFPGYIFVRMPLRDRLRVQQIPGVARLVGFDGTPAALPEEEIEVLRRGLTRDAKAQPHPYLKIGQRVRVRSGPLHGLMGVLRRRKSGTQLVVSVDLIMRSVALEIDEVDLEIA